jgi:hypothetical protein
VAVSNERGTQMKIVQHITDFKIEETGYPCHKYSASAVVDGQFYVILYLDRPSWKQVMEDLVGKMER